MKYKLLVTLVTIPVLAAGYILFHPGVGFTVTALAQTGAAADSRTEGDFTVDPAHTCVGFDVGHLGISRVQGRFNKLSGSIHADSKRVSNSNVMITIDASSIDTAVPPRDADLRSANFFDVAKYPEITFSSTSMRKHGKGYIADGNLTMHGVTKPVSIRFMVYGPIKDPRGKVRIGMVSEPLTIQRSDYGITNDASSVSDDVRIRLSLEATLNG
jgi:polyisoprenoid-binding protein YceI